MNYLKDPKVFLPAILGLVVILYVALRIGAIYSILLVVVCIVLVSKWLTNMTLEKTDGLSSLIHKHILWAVIFGTSLITILNISLAITTLVLGCVLYHVGAWATKKWDSAKS